MLASGKAAEAIPIYRELRELVRRGRSTGTYAGYCINLAIALVEAGESEAAKEATAEGQKELFERRKVAPLDTSELLIMGQLAAVGGQMSEAEQYLAKALEKGIKDPDTEMLLAEIYALTGQEELAIATLKRALDSGYPDYYFPLIIPAFQSIRNDSRFRALFGLKNN